MPKIVLITRSQILFRSWVMGHGSMCIFLKSITSLSKAIYSPISTIKNTWFVKWCSRWRHKSCLLGKSVFFGLSKISTFLFFPFSFPGISYSLLNVQLNKPRHHRRWQLFYQRNNHKTICTTIKLRTWRIPISSIHTPPFKQLDRSRYNCSWTNHSWYTRTRKRHFAAMQSS